MKEKREKQENKGRRGESFGQREEECLGVSENEREIREEKTCKLPKIRGQEAIAENRKTHEEQDE